MTARPDLYAAALDCAASRASEWLESLPDRPIPPSEDANNVLARLGGPLPEGPTEPAEGLCCVGRAGAMAERSPGQDSDGERQLIERNSNSVVDRCVGGNVVVAASEVLDEGVAGSKDPC